MADHKSGHHRFMVKQGRSWHRRLPLRPSLRPDDGVALLITILILLIVSLIGATVVNLGRIDYELSGNYRSSTASLSLADSALSATVADLRADYDTDPSASALSDWLDLASVPVSVADPFPDATASQVNGHSLSPAAVHPDPYSGSPYRIGNPVPLGSGTYTRTIWLPPTLTSTGGTTTANFRVRAEGTDSSRATPATTIIDGVLTVDLQPSGAYASAVRLGAGDGGEVISGGSVGIAGPVTVIGETGSTVLRLSSSSSVTNGYAGIDGVFGLGSLAGKLPELAMQEYNGETVAALNAALRLKDAELVVDPLATLGSPDSPGNAYKETLDGLYTDDGVTAGDENVHIDAMGGWDLGDVTFPSLADPYVDGETGAAYASYEAYLDTIAYAPLGEGDLVIAADTPSFSYVSARGDGTLAWDASTQTLTIDGVVKIDGNVILGDIGSSGGTADPSGGRRGGRGGGRGGDPGGGGQAPGGDRGGRGQGGGPGGGGGAIKYEGSGVLWAGADMEITRDLYPVGQYLEDGSDAGSEVDGNLGLLTANEIRLAPAAGLNNLKVFAALFAEQRVDVAARTNVAGSIVTGHINLGGLTRLNLWYVPGLSINAPAGMPGATGMPTVNVGMTDWYQVR